MNILSSGSSNTEYSYVPAALTPSMTCGAFYITHGRTGVRHVDYQPLATGSITRLPDRTIHFVYHPKARPLDTNFDYCISFSPYEPGSWADLIGLKHFLVSAYHGIGERIRNRAFIHNDMKLIADSGGAQLKFAVGDETAFVDPRKILWWMNECADVGMTLDFAPRPVDQGNKAAMKALAKMSRTSNKFFARNKTDRLHLCNITHGFTLEDVRRWTDTVAMPGFDGWACGADVRNNNIANLRILLVPMLEQEQVSHYHLFGFSGRKKTPAMAWMARRLGMLREKKKLKPAVVTSDSTTWLTMAKWRAFMTFDPRSGHSELLPVGKRHKLKNGLHIPCSCFMCANIGWIDYYDLPPQSYAGRALAIHNLYILHQQVEFWNKHAALAKNVDEYMEIVEWSFPKKREIRDMVRYVDAAFEHGLDKADERFRGSLPDRPTRLAMKPLFRSAKDAADLSFEDLPSAVENIDKYKDFKWKTEVPLYPFEKRKRKGPTLLADAINPDVAAELNTAQIAEVLGDDIDVTPPKKGAGKASP